jgi:hypothetical protein
VADGYVSREELNGVGVRVSQLEIKHAECRAGLSQKVLSLESWTKDQEADLNILKEEQKKIEIESKERDAKLETKMVSLKESIVKEISTRVGLYGVLIVVAVAAIEFLGKLVK